jgi:hypothetical protein
MVAYQIGSSRNPHKRRTPLEAAESSARWMAGPSSAIPSPTAPKSRTERAMGRRQPFSGVQPLLLLLEIIQDQAQFLGSLPGEDHSFLGRGREIGPDRFLQPIRQFDSLEGRFGFRRGGFEYARGRRDFALRPFQDGRYRLRRPEASKDSRHSA